MTVIDSPISVAGSEDVFTNELSRELWLENYKYYKENTVDESFRRVARAIASVEKTEEKRQEWEEKFYDLLNNFKVTAAGRIFANAGTDRKGVTLINCFVGPRPKYDIDSLDGIYETARMQAQTLKSEGGWGMNFSFIRPRGSFIYGVGVETPGAVKYMELFDKGSDIITAGSGRKSIKIGAKVKIRKGAMMGVLDIWHPDIIEFIKAKQKKDYLSKFNVSVNCSNMFMDKVVKCTELKKSGLSEDEINKDHRWNFIYPDTTHSEYKSEWDGNISRWIGFGYPVNNYGDIGVLELWNLITSSTYRRNEPGVMFCDIANKTHCWNYGGQKAWISASNPCVTKDTWIMTSNGPKQVSDLIDNCFDARLNGVSYNSSYLGFYKTGIKETFKITTNNGFSFECTGDHKIQCTDGNNNIYWKAAQDLSNRDNLVINNNLNESWSGNGDFGEGWLIGSLLGDGCFSNDSAYLAYWGSTKDHLKQYAVNQINEFAQHKVGVSAGQGTVTRDTRDMVGVQSKELCRLALDRGLSIKKNISKELEKNSSNFYKGFLSGWFDADGSVMGTQNKGCSVRLASTKLHNLYTAQRMLARLGIISKIYLNRYEAGYRDLPDGKGGNKAYYCQPMHELIIANESLSKFTKIIGFIDPIKQDKLQNIASNYKRNVNKDKFYTKFFSRVSTGLKEVYDCSVNEIHAFDANGIIVHNCGEQTMPNGSICDLASQNLTQFVDITNGCFDLPKIAKYAKYLVRFLDNVITYTNLPLEEYAYFAVNSRRIGIGVMGWGSALYMLKTRFASDKAEQLKYDLMKTLTHAAVEASVELAEEKGMFPWCEPEKHAKSAFWDQIELPEELKARIAKSGIRNSSLFSIQPTGNTGVLANLVSGGGEPVFLPEYIRTSIVNIIPDHIKDICPDFHKNEFHETDMFKWYKEGDEQILRGIDKFGIVYKIDKNRGLTKETLCEDYGVKYLKSIGQWDSKADWAVTTTTLTTEEHIRDMQGFAKWLDAAMSKTINLPNDYDFNKFQDVYLDAYKTNYIKGLTTYRAGTMTSVLSGTDEKQQEKSKDRPKDLPCDIHHIKVKGQGYFIFVGLNDGKPYEIFAGKNGHIEKSIKKGVVTKVKSHYKIAFDDGSEIPDISKDVTDTEEALARLISLSLRNGVEILDIVKQLERTDGDIYDFGKSISRALKKYILDGTKDGDRCSECQSELVREAGCAVCKNCGWSKC